ncbi:MAG TPA: DNA polymerase I [candidate division Zixibacteria bacterium]
MNRKKLFLIDGSALVYRSYFAFIRNPLINSRGENTSAVFGFANSLLKILREQKPDYIAVVFDTPAPTFRHKIYKDYKSTRAKTPPEMVEQLPRIRELVGYMNLPLIEKDGFEADDIIGTLAEQGKKEGLEVFLVTADKDFFQLVDEDIKMVRPSKGKEPEEIYDAKAVKEKFGIEPNQMTDLLGLMGDSSDNIPGVPGIGEKTALELINQFGSLEDVIAGADRISKKKVSQNLKEYAEQARFSKKLVTIDTAAPFKLDLRELSKKDFDSPKLRQFFKEMEFTSFLRELSSDKKEEEKVIYKTVQSLDELETLIEVLKQKREFAFDTETDSLDYMNANLVGVSICYQPKEAYYLPLSHQTGDKHKNLDKEKALLELKSVLEDEKIKKIGQNLKFDLEVLKNSGVDLRGIYFDAMLASYLLDPSSRQHNLTYLALRYFDHEMIPLKSLIGSGKKEISFDMVPIECASQYSCEDADYTLRLKDLFATQLSELKLDKLFFEVEVPLIEVLADMEMTGVSIDTAYLKSMSIDLEKDLKRLEKEIYQLAGKEFNINSPQQLGQILFEELKLTPIRKTEKKTGESTDFAVLEELAREHPLPKILLEYRLLSKLKSTYADALPSMVNPKTKRIHTSFNQTVTATGRLSSSEPNLQNIPIKTEMGSRIRKAFIPRNSDYKLLCADYSQIELRILAHFSKDEKLIESFRKGEDIHSRTASEVFGVPLNEVTPQQRRQAKTANFAVIYGVSPYGLSQQTEMTPKEAKEFIDVYFAQHPQVKEYIDNCIEKARRDGYVTTLLGRRRYIPEITSRNRQRREFAERTAINTPIQGSAADLIKVVMLDIRNLLTKKKTKSKMILQVHDELVFEVHKEELHFMKDMVRDKMEGCVKLEVPIKVDIGIGENWLETK